MTRRKVMAQRLDFGLGFLDGLEVVLHTDILQ